MKRRNNNEGSFTKRNNHVQARYYERNADGLLIRKYKTFKDSKTAVEYVRKKQKAKEMTINLTLGQWLERYLSDYCRNKAESTQKTYRTLIYAHVIQCLGNIQLQEIKPADINALYSNLDLKPRSIRTIHSILTAAFNAAILNDLIIKNPTRGCQLPKIVKRNYRILSESEFKQFFEASQKSRYKFALLFMLLCGLRRGEALGVKWKDINFISKTITISRQIVEIDGVVQSKDSVKTSKSFRTISVDDSFIALLRKERKSIGYITPLPKSINSFVVEFKRIIKNFGIIDYMRPHDLRHTHASHLLHSNFPLPLLSQRLGHSSTKITGDIYSHEIPNADDAAAETMENLINKGE